MFTPRGGAAYHIYPLKNLAMKLPSGMDRAFRHIDLHVPSTRSRTG